MIILLLLMSMVLRNGLTAIVGFEAVENNLLMKLGKVNFTQQCDCVAS